MPVLTGRCPRRAMRVSSCHVICAILAIASARACSGTAKTVKTAEKQVLRDDRIRRLIEVLGAEAIEEREEAGSMLAGFGEVAEPLLKQARGHPDGEVRARVQDLLFRIHRSRNLTMGTPSRGPGRGQLYVCPNHATQIMTRTPSICGVQGCGHKLTPALYLCPEHVRVQGNLPGFCGMPRCAMPLELNWQPSWYECQDHTWAWAMTPGFCGAPGCEKPLVLQRWYGDSLPGCGVR